jgi:hypothetical protein
MDLVGYSKHQRPACVNGEMLWRPDLKVASSSHASGDVAKRCQSSMIYKADDIRVDLANLNRVHELGEYSQLMCKTKSIVHIDHPE